MPPPRSAELDVIVPTYRRPALLRRCLRSLATQELDLSRFHVVVVDDGSGDETASVIEAAQRALPNLTPLTQPTNRGPAAARNRGIAEARSGVVVFLDDDVTAAPDLLGMHGRLHAGASDPLIGFLGRVEWHPDLRVTPFMRWLDHSGFQFAYDTWLKEGPVEPPYAAFYTANLSVPRHLLEQAGGFDERFPYPNYEDMELAWRLAKRGFRLWYRPAALAFHARPIDLKTFVRRMRNEAESAVLFQALQPEFPLDTSRPRKGAAGARRRLALRLRAPLAARRGDDRLLERHYRAEIAAAYRDGTRRGQRRLEQRVAG